MKKTTLMILFVQFLNITIMAGEPGFLANASALFWQATNYVRTNERNAGKVELTESTLSKFPTIIQPPATLPPAPTLAPSPASAPAPTYDHAAHDIKTDSYHQEAMTNGYQNTDTLNKIKQDTGTLVSNASKYREPSKFEKVMDTGGKVLGASRDIVIVGAGVYGFYYWVRSNTYPTQHQLNEADRRKLALEKMKKKLQKAEKKEKDGNTREEFNRCISQNLFAPKNSEGMPITCNGTIERFIQMAGQKSYEEEREYFLARVKRNS